MHPTRSKLVALALFVLGTTTASAASISYQATDIADSGAGDAWQYTYFVSGHTFAEREAFSILFDVDSYANLNPTPAPVSGWEILVLEPSVGLPADGRYEPMSLADGTSANVAFTIDFVWKGTGAPGSQPFEIIQYDPDFNPTTLESGVTVPAEAVPEPSTWMLVSGAVGMFALRRRTS
ncbi:MAG TPA: PEP-CTERM sorting domain-containing protein [Bryobacteraceae bacterium]|nr:PEP-CTERM sorting domain-containing protein [Bryobacteraceae bacterium]